MKKVQKIEIDTNSIRILTENNLITTKPGSVLNVEVDRLYFSLFPAMGIYGRDKKSMLQRFKEMDMVLKSQKIKGGVFVGMTKLSTFNNMLKLLKEHRLKAKHLHLSTFNLDRFSFSGDEDQIVIYRSDTAMHVMVLKSEIPVFTTTYFSTAQLDEFLKEYFEDGNAQLTLLANSRWDYTPPIEFKKQHTIFKEGVILNAIP